MLNEHYDVTTAAYAVGYESLSHFSREYLRMFGESPKRDITRFSAKTDLIDGTNILPFQARYIALGQSVAGTANADATFKVQYL